MKESCLTMKESCHQEFVLEFLLFSIVTFRCFFIVKTFFYVFLLLTLNMFWLAMMPIGIPSRSTTGFINGSTHWKLISLPQNESKTSHKL